MGKLRPLCAGTNSSAYVLSICKGWASSTMVRPHRCARETSIIASCTPPTGDLAHNPGTRPNQESNQRPFSFLDDAKPTKLQKSGPDQLLNSGIEEIRKYQSVFYLIKDKYYPLEVLSHIHMCILGCSVRFIS